MGLFSRFFRKKEVVDFDISSLENLEILDLDSSKTSRSVIIPGINKTPGVDQKISSRGINYFTTNTREWIAPQYDHLEVEILYDIEGYFARATRAKLALFFKEGFSYVGKNDDTIRYIKTRFKQIERATDIPTELLLLWTFRDLVVHSNCYWLKVRKLEASGGRMRQVGDKSIIPIAGYFRLPPETMVPELDRYGNIVRWKQDIGGVEKIYKKEDIVHFYTNMKAGYPLGVPRVIPAIDDIRALRSLEHNVDILIHKHIFPIILWKVGTTENPAMEFPNGETEIDILKEEIEDLPTEGSLVVPERYDVKAIGVENKALKVEGYLNHFRERIFADLDVSSIDVGLGNTSSRSTASTLSRNLVDTVKMDQLTIEGFIRLVIEELLLESTFDSKTVLNDENLVYLKFKEIDKESKQAEENHLVDMFHKNTITWPEMRMGIGREILSKEEEKELFYYKIGREIELIKSVDENSGKGVNLDNQSVANKNTPQNQHGTRSSAKLNRDSFNIYAKDISINPILRWHKIIEKSLQEAWHSSGEDIKEAQIQVSLGYNEAEKELLTTLRININSIYPDPIQSDSIYRLCSVRLKESIAKLKNELLLLIENKKSPTAAFKTLEYRARLIYSSSLNYSTNLSRYRFFSDNQIDMTIKSDETCCNICESKLTTIKWNDKLGSIKIPPFHFGCGCLVEALK